MVSTSLKYFILGFIKQTVEYQHLSNVDVVCMGPAESAEWLKVKYC